LPLGSYNISYPSFLKNTENDETAGDEKKVLFKLRLREMQVLLIVNQTLLLFNSTPKYAIDIV